MKKMVMIIVAACLFPGMVYAADMSVAAGNAHTILLKSDGTVWTWGKNDFGQLGNGANSNSPIPVNVSNLVNISSVDGGESHTIALKSDKTVWCWGKNGSGQLGNGIDKKNSFVPTEVLKFRQENSAIIAVAAGQYHSAVLQDNGTVWTWGYNYFSQLGYGGTTDSISPWPASNVSNVIAIASGNNHLLALNNDGTVRAWGYNLNGQIGDGTTTTQPNPANVRADVNSDFGNIKSIAAGYNHSFAVKNDATAMLWAWGKNSNGQLGNGTTTNSLYPAKVKLSDNSDFSDIKSIAGGENHSLALKNDGTVWAWGDNSKGQLGDGSKTQRINPVQVQNLDHVIFIAAGANHSLAIRNDGSLWAWGDNASGQLGDKAPKPCLTPVQIFMPGDLNLDTKIDLKDAILSLQVLADIVPSETVYSVSEISADAKIGLEETVYVLQVVSGLR